MHKAPDRSIALVNAKLRAGESVCLRIERGRIASLDTGPQREDLVIDLRGDRVLPGLINAHDHLQLNSLPRLKYREGYGNATEWIEDISPRLDTDPMFIANRAVPREERLLLGGVKNLLSGVTTVAHHDPLYPALVEESYPIRVVTQYGWAHSLAMDGPDSVRHSFTQTSPNRPWIIHAAEGTDAAAAGEFSRLHSLGCIASNTVLVHGTALSATEHRKLAAAGGALVWCPASNRHLFGRTIDVAALRDREHITLGTDSRLSGSVDLLAELRLARELADLDESELEGMVTERAGRLLRLSDRGSLQAGALADIVVLPADMPLSHADRADIALVLVGGEPGYSDPRYEFAFGDDGCAAVRVDGRAKCLPTTLASRLRKAGIQEPGLTLSSAAIQTSVPRMRRAAV